MSDSENPLDQLLKRAVAAGASDLHLKIGLPPVLRVAGDLKVLSREEPPISREQFMGFLQPLLPAYLKPAFEAGREIDLAYGVSGVGRFRVNLFKQRGQWGMVLRFIPYNIKSLEELGLPSVLSKLALCPRGLFLVTGVAGSGKSSTLAALIQEWNTKQGGHIVSIEDPIEYLIRDKKAIITQRELGLDTESFETGLKNALRQDPDVIMIGELRDRSSVQVALNAAETGHLVLSTLHTKDAVESIDRLLGLFDADSQEHVRSQLASVLVGVISQRLVAAKEKKGSMICATELLVNTARVADIIRDPKKHGDLPRTLEESASDGMHTFDQCLIELYKSGKISKKEAMANATRPADLDLRMRGIE